MLIFFGSSFARSVLGFGDALLAMPLLVLVIEPRIATPLFALIASTVALTMLIEHRQHIDLTATWRLVVASALGIPIGLLALKGGSEQMIKTILGILLILFGLYNLVRPRLPALQREVYAYLFGFVAGVLGGAYNTNGPPVVIYGTLRRWPPERFRATLQGYFVPTGLFILTGHALAGLWTMQVFRLYACCLPLVFLALFLGNRVSQRLSVQRFQGIVYVFLIIMGIVLIV